nr:MAG TPA: (Na+)-NQR maturation protein [Caudoviricetes sp.]DAY08255.1 MAG TPA: (Na+)-NQR maturation protein [Caudoviricetes sp.]
MTSSRGTRRLRRISGSCTGLTSMVITGCLS